MNRFGECIFLLLALALPQAMAAQPAESHVKAELLAETTAFLRDGDTALALRLSPEPGWHTYWLNPGDSGTATSLAWTLPENVTASAMLWPAPRAFTTAGLVNYGYAEPALHLVSVAVPASTGLGPLTVQAQAKWLACRELCIPGAADLSLTMPVADTVELDAGNAAAFETARAALPQTAAESWRMQFAIEGQRLTLAVQGGDFAQVAAAEFFVANRKLLEHAAPQALAIDGSDALRVSQAISSRFDHPPESVEGVLALSLRDGSRQTYSITAVAGTVPMLPAAATPQKQAVSAAASSAQALAPASTVTLPLALMFALLGGLVLNLMPCVFPVLTLKAYAVLSAPSSSAQRSQALAYTAGTVASCVAAAGLLLALRAGGEALGWGFQLQSPVFVAAMIYVLFALGLSMSGVIELGAGLMGTGSSLASKQGLTGSFFTGVLAVVVASPCTAPFMGSALGFAVTQPVAVALSVFAALGLGLALPFVAIGVFPALARRLPRPGAWMQLFKQAMAFPMYLTCAWLAWVLTRQAGADALGLLAVGLVLVALAMWLYGRPQRGGLSLAIAALAALAVAATLFSPFMRSPAAGVANLKIFEQGREPWSAARLAALRGEGRTVFVNFTADWCITCKVNERGALKSGAVEAAFKASDTVWLTGDWTLADPAITAELARFGRNGVPLYLVYARGGEPQVLPQILTPQAVTEAIRR